MTHTHPAGVEVLPPLRDETDREQWLVERMKGIGASEAAAIMGLSPYPNATPWRVWREKTRRAAPFTGNDSTDWGSEKEALIGARYARRTGKILNPGGLYRSSEMEIVLATPDFLVEFPDDEVVEVKTANWRVAHHWAKGVPVYYLPQVQQQMFVLGKRRAQVVAEIGCAPPQAWAVDRDDEFIAKLIETAEWFWWHVENDVPPPHEETRTLEELAEAYPTQTGTAIELDFETELQWLEYNDARNAETAAGRRKKAADEAIRRYQGHHQYATLGGRPVVTLTPGKDEEVFDAERLRVERPDIYAQYLTTKPAGKPRISVKR